MGWREKEGWGQIELPSQVVEDADGDDHMIGDKASEEPQRTQLEGKTPAIVVAATSEDLSGIGF